MECSIGECDGSGASVYNINSFKEVINFKEISNIVKISFDKSMPIVCRFEDVMGDVELTTLLAPIIKND